IATASLICEIQQENWDRISSSHTPLTLSEWFALLESTAYHHVIVALIGFSVAYVSYRCAVVRIVPWGDLVKSAFDCYLPALIKQLGYAVPPTERGRRKFWSEINALVLYQWRMTQEWPLASASTVQNVPKDPNSAKTGDAAEGNNTPSDE